MGRCLQQAGWPHMKSRTKKKVLIIDDNPVIGFFLEGYFKTNNYSVSFAQTAQRGMDMAQNLVPDLILVQGKLPESTGIAVVQHLRRKSATQDIPVVFYTGSHRERMRYRLNPPPGTWYLHSPWDAARLHEIIREDIFEDAGNESCGIRDNERNRLKRRAL